jgi:hypothetical protein
MFQDFLIAADPFNSSQVGLFAGIIGIRLRRDKQCQRNQSVRDMSSEGNAFWIGCVRRQDAGIAAACPAEYEARWTECDFLSGAWVTEHQRAFRATAD